MGDRANIQVITSGEEVFLYTHWGGHKIECILKAALERARDRWDDPQYLARIIFCEMIQDDVMGLTGFGISSKVGDGDNHIIKVNVDKQIVTTSIGELPFKDFVKL